MPAGLMRRAAAADTGGPWFAPLNPVAKPRRTLVCFPFGGGSTTAYRSWREHVPADVELFGVELPGHGTRFSEPLLQGVDQAVASLMQQQDFFRDRAPMVFFGHSLGALVAFELAVALERAGGASPVHVVVSGRSPPHLARRGPPIHGLPDARFLEEVTRFGGLPDEVLQHPELVEFILPILRADFRMSESAPVRSDAALRCDLTALAGVDDPMVDFDAMSGWQRHAAGRFRLKAFAGAHFFLQHHVADIVALALDVADSPAEDRR